MTNDETLDPAPDEFVLRVAASDKDALARARKLGTVESLESAPQLYLLRVTPGKTPREAWQSAVRELGDALLVFPVLYDRGGTPHYPTGEVTVRFEAPPTESDLRHFCDAQGVRFLRRNEFVAQQVVCEPVDAACEFLPDLVMRIAAQPGVRRAWANTFSRYRREGGRSGSAT
jgi:hypothetical protein